MSRSRPHPNLTAEAEELLGHWPLPERGEVEWEALANRTVERCKAGSVEDGIDVLAAPLPAAPGEESFELAEEPPPGLADIARAVVSDDRATALRQVAREGLRVATQEHVAPRQAPPADARSAAPQAERVPIAAAPAPEQPDSDRPGTLAGHEAAARSILPRPPRWAHHEQARGVVWFGVIVAAAAGSAFYLGLKVRDDVRMAQISSAATERPLAPSARGEPALPATATVALNELPAPDDKGAEAAPSNRDARRLRTAKPSAKNAAPEGVEEPVAARTDAPAAPLAPKTQEASRGDLPAEPGLGAVQAAIGSVMMPARNCLAGQETGSRATLVFGSDGRARSVSVSGPAAGTPAEGCLKAALMGARVPAFAEPTYSAALTIRPP